MLRLYINEVQFDRVLAPLITEAAETLDSIYTKWYTDIPSDEFMKIVNADPTYNQDKRDKMGKYGKWLLGLYRKNKLKIEDLYKATEYLTYFNKYINKIEQKDIMRYQDLPSLYDAVSTFIDAHNSGNNIATSKSDEVRMAKQHVKKVYEDNNWLILIPLTKEAAIYYGKHTQWCTAAEKGNNMFGYYTSQGPLYINIDKRTNRKYQFHFQSDQFMDERDNQIDDVIAETINMDSSVVEKAYPHAIDTLLNDSTLNALGDGLYFNPYNYEIYKLVGAGMFQNEMGYERQVITKASGERMCFKLSKDVWWFQKFQQSCGVFYNIRTNQTYENNRFHRLIVYTSQKENIPQIIGTEVGKFGGLHSFIGHMDGDELVVDQYLHTSSHENMTVYIEDNFSYYDIDYSKLNKLLVLYNNSDKDAIDGENPISVFDLEENKKVLDYVVTYKGCMESGDDDKLYISFRDAISEESVYQRAEELVDDNELYDDEDEDGYYYDDSEDIEGIASDLKDNFINNEAKIYYLCIDDGQIYDSINGH